MMPGHRRRRAPKVKLAPGLEAAAERGSATLPFLLTTQKKKKKKKKKPTEPHEYYMKALP